MLTNMTQQEKLNKTFENRRKNALRCGPILCRVRALKKSPEKLYFGPKKRKI